MVEFLGEWSDMTARQRAVLIKTSKQSLSDERVAAAVGVNRTTLYAWPEYMRLKRALTVLPSLPRGTVDDEGFIESYLTNPD